MNRAPTALCRVTTVLLLAVATAGSPLPGFGAITPTAAPAPAHVAATPTEPAPSIANAIASAEAALPRKRDLNAEQRKQAEDLLRDALADDRRADEEAAKVQAFREEADHVRESELHPPPTPKDAALAFAEWRAQLPQDEGVERLSDRVELQRNELAAAQDALRAVEDALEKATNRPDPLRDELVAARAQAEEKPAPLPAAPQSLKEIETLRTQAAQRLARWHIAALEMEQRTLEARLRSLFAQRSERRRDVEAHRQRAHLLENMVLDRANSAVADIATKLAHTRDELVAAKAEPPQAQVATETLDLGNDLVATLKRMGDLRDVRNGYAGELADTVQAEKNAQARIELGGISEDVGALLLAERRKLKPLAGLERNLAALGSELAQTKLRLLDLRAQEDGLENMDAAIARTLTQAGKLPVLTGELHDKLRDLLTTRSDVLTRLLAAKSRQVQLLGDTEQQLANLTSHTKALLGLLNAHLLGTPSHAAVGTSWFEDVGRALKSLGNTKAMAGLFDARRAGLLLPLAAVLALLMKLFMRTRVPQIFAKIAVPMRRIRSDRYRFTILALVLTIIAATPIPALWWLLGRLFQRMSGGEPLGTSLGVACTTIAIPWFALAFLGWLCRENGLAHLHFRWTRARRSALRRSIYSLVPALLLPIFAHTWMREFNYEDADTSLGRGLFILGWIAVAAIAWRMMRPGGAWLRSAPVQTEPVRLRQFARVGLSGLFLCLAILAILGYIFTAITLAEHVLRSMGALLVVAVLDGLAVRWMMLGARRLALKRAEDRMLAERSTGEGDSEGETPRELDFDETAVADLSAQSRRVLQLAIRFMVVATLLVVWSDIAPALSFLDKITVWQSSSVDAAGKTVGFDVTLRAVLEAILVLAVTFTATRNLPGLLEIGVLRRIKLDAPMRYAITSVVRYLIVLIGVLTGIALLGVQWSNLQWLAAGLTVGLGFGMQEIFANFVSGLIVLFEQPCRVGDIVTIGNVEGTVTRIRTRATTIVDWDNKEVIVPNKSFITERLTNWTLSDSTTRVVIKVGIDDASDPRLAQRLLLDTAAAHDLVLKDPPPLAWMMTFGESSNELELRFFVAEIVQRNLVRSELMMRIAEAFAANGIVLANPQRDIWLRNAPQLTDPKPVGSRPQRDDSADEISASKRS